MSIKRVDLEAETVLSNLELNVLIAKALGFKFVASSAIPDGCWMYPNAWEMTRQPETNIPDFIAMALREHRRLYLDGGYMPKMKADLQDLPTIQVNTEYKLEANKAGELKC